jgi:hypothetical protein
MAVPAGASAANDLTSIMAYGIGHNRDSAEKEAS